MYISGKILPTDGALERLPEKRRYQLQMLSYDVKIALIEQREADAIRLMLSITDADETVALWTFFTSTQRSTLKRILKGK